MPECIFCKIITGQLNSQVVYKDDHATVFHDIHPLAPTHLLIVPNQHIASVNDVIEDNETLLGHLFTVAKTVAKQEGIDQSGYRLVVNTGPHSGQGVFHLHMHILGGQRLHIPMG
jgi:histidine triad (HIT) family protein